MNTFEQTIRELRNGNCVGDLNAQLVELVKNVRLTGKKGALNLRITISPATKGDTNVVAAEDEIKLVLPKEEKTPSIFFTTEDNQLVRNDPRQRELPLRVIDQPDQGEVRQVANS